MSRERGILFSAPMILALLAGRKAQTRRLLDEKKLRVTLPNRVTGDLIFEHVAAKAGKHKATLYQGGAVSVVADDGSKLGVKPGEFDFCCPYAKGVTRLRPDRGGWEIVPHPGQRLWVREDWRTSLQLNDCDAAAIAKKCDEANYDGPWCPVEYLADGKVRDWDPDWGMPGRKRIARFMPRWLSRLSLEVTAVRVQRLQDISEEDARAEGIIEWSDGPSKQSYYGLTVADVWETSARWAFKRIWDEINGERAPWSSNPWVWSVTFKKTEVTPCP